MTQKIEAFVIGAQKSGTTALHAFLSEHPQIQMGVRKELHLFDSEQVDWQVPLSDSIVDSLYPSGDGLRMDITPIYLYWPHCLARIARYNPNARVIVLLRDPIERAYSHWKMEYKRGTESLDFSAAIRGGRNRFDRFHRVYSYIERGLYADQLDRVFRLFSAEQVLILKQQDLLDQHEVTLTRICRFLGCDDFPALPAAKVIFSSGGDHQVSTPDRRYLELVYRDANERLFQQYGIDFRVPSSKKHPDVTFWVPTDFPAAEGILSIEHCVQPLSDDGNVVWFPHMVLEDLMNPHLQKLARALQRQGLTYNYLNTYGMLGKSFSLQFQRWLTQNHPTRKDHPIVVLFPTDMEYPYDVPDSVICLRTSMVTYKQRPLDIAIPLPWLSWEEAYPPATQYSVGFCGVPNHPSRRRLLQALQSQASIRTNFIFRDRFWGRIREQGTPEQVEQLRQEYIDNLRDNVFTVCSRGAGNYSIRFYETLRAGRIPVMLDTAMVFPLADMIDYREFVICEPTPELVIQRMQEWIETRDLEAIQQRCRQVWETYLYFLRFLETLPVLLQPLLTLNNPLNDP